MQYIIYTDATKTEIENIIIADDTFCNDFYPDRWELYTHETEIDEPTPTLIPINVTTITGDIKHASDFSLVTGEESVPMVISGTVDVPDDIFNLPVKWKGDYIVFRITVTNGQFSIPVLFTDSGIGIIDDECVNMRWAQPMFTIKPIRFEIVRRMS